MRDDVLYCGKCPCYCAPRNGRHPFEGPDMSVSESLACGKGRLLGRRACRRRRVEGGALLRDCLRFGDGRRDGEPIRCRDRACHYGCCRYCLDSAQHMSVGLSSLRTRPSSAVLGTGHMGRKGGGDLLRRVICLRPRHGTHGSGKRVLATCTKRSAPSPEGSSSALARTTGCGEEPAPGSTHV